MSKQYLVGWTNGMEAVYGAENLENDALGRSRPAIHTGRMSFEDALKLWGKWPNAASNTAIYKLVRVGKLHVLKQLVWNFLSRLKTAVGKTTGA